MGVVVHGLHVVQLFSVPQDLCLQTVKPPLECQALVLERGEGRKGKESRGYETILQYECFYDKLLRAVLTTIQNSVNESTFTDQWCVCWTNLEVSFHFLIVDHDVLSLFALELCLLQTVLQRPQFLRNHNNNRGYRSVFFRYDFL